jgi:hypothetical protein
MDDIIGNDMDFVEWEGGFVTGGTVPYLEYPKAAGDSGPCAVGVGTARFSVSCESDGK